MTDKPRPSPRPPDDSAALRLDKTPSHFPVTAEYVRRKLEERDRERGKPVLPKALAPWLLAGFLLCGAVTSAAVTYPDDIPRGIMVVATVGSLFFGGMLASSSGLRK